MGSYPGSAIPFTTAGRAASAAGAAALIADRHDAAADKALVDQAIAASDWGRAEALRRVATRRG